MRFVAYDVPRTALGRPPRTSPGSTSPYRRGRIPRRLARRAGSSAVARGLTSSGWSQGCQAEAGGLTGFVAGFRAGARRASPGIKVLVDYSNDFVDTSKCAALASSQIAKGAGAVFDVAGECGLGALAAAKEGDVWGIGVDSDMSSLGPYILTSVVKRFDVGFVTLLRKPQDGRIPTARTQCSRSGAAPSAWAGSARRCRRDIPPGTRPAPAADHHRQGPGSGRPGSLALRRRLPSSPRPRRAHDRRPGPRGCLRSRSSPRCHRSRGRSGGVTPPLAALPRRLLPQRRSRRGTPRLGDLRIAAAVSGSTFQS